LTAADEASSESVATDQTSDGLTISSIASLTLSDAQGQENARSPACFRTCSTSNKVEMAPIWAFCAPFD
jgi:hypothetical protein